MKKQLTVWMKKNKKKNLEVANAVGVTRQTVGNWQAGRSVPTLTVAIRLEYLSGGEVSVHGWMK